MAQGAVEDRGVDAILVADGVREPLEQQGADALGERGDGASRFLAERLDGRARPVGGRLDGCARLFGGRLDGCCWLCGQLPD
ncbi:hypothetical protein [Streptomyces aurantiacus]|uniref:hypothetical protein n=1 Tax=Streptomyces aurantiacus TaxID=47760 RepID=UPI00216B1E8E|nr:hypothetical protein [Streptomyces aurantiacus]